MLVANAPGQVHLSQALNSHPVKSDMVSAQHARLMGKQPPHQPAPMVVPLSANQAGAAGQLLPPQFTQTLWPHTSSSLRLVAGQVPMQMQVSHAGMQSALYTVGPMQQQVGLGASTVQPVGMNSAGLQSQVGYSHSHPGELRANPQVIALITDSRVTGCSITGCRVTDCMVTGWRCTE